MVQKSARVFIIVCWTLSVKYKLNSIYRPYCTLYKIYYDIHNKDEKYEAETYSLSNSFKIEHVTWYYEEMIQAAKSLLYSKLKILLYKKVNVLYTYGIRWAQAAQYTTSCYSVIKFCITCFQTHRKIPLI